MEKEELEYQTLTLLAGAGEPLGCGTVAERLRAIGTTLSEATAGRFLRETDLRGLTARAGFRGRVLTPLGKERLEQLRAERQRAICRSEFIKLLRAHGRDELLEVMVARRAIERETARLAAMKARDEDIEELNEILLEHEAHTYDEPYPGMHDTMFHKRVARMSGNRVLEAATDLIRQDGQVTQVLDWIRKEVKSSVVSDHREILNALKRRDPVAAEKAMVKHLENVAQEIEECWDIVWPTEMEKIISMVGAH
jgi:GntR family L-lactate dehydrogenase operon transcriptional regulator